MRALVVYDSMFGNTRRIAGAVADGLAGYGTVDLVPVDRAPQRLADDVTLVVVGGPTHVHGLSTHTTRTVNPQQADQGAEAGRIGLKEWVTTVAATNGTPVATFDTRFHKARWVTGSAATSAAKVLRRRGYRLAAPPESFFVEHGNGPLESGELYRAQAWGDKLGATVLAETAGTR